MVIARNCRFGGEGGGFTVVLNKASFLTVGHDGSMAPQSGPLPNGTGWEGNPQVSALTKPEGRQTHTNGLTWALDRSERGDHPGLVPDRQRWQQGAAGQHLAGAAPRNPRR